MKAINLRSFGILALLIFAFSSQAVFADIILKKDNTDPGTVGSMVTVNNSLKATSLKSTSLKIQSIIPVTADLINGELGVFFSSSVGIATVSVVDQYGNIVEMTTIDTNSSSELYILTDGWEAGTYTLKISYGTTNLVGDFQL
jgi:hypothetical protein